MNFTYITTKPREGAFGNLQDDGSWNGMVGNLKNLEGDVGEPFEIFDNNILASAQQAKLLNARSINYFPLPFAGLHGL